GGDSAQAAADHRQVHSGLSLSMAAARGRKPKSAHKRSARARRALRILVTNDDGVYSEGIKLLAGALSDLGEVVVVAPDREQSATGHSLTLHRPLRLQQAQENWYSVDGTTTACVNLAVLWLLRKRKPDLGGAVGNIARPP